MRKDYYQILGIEDFTAGFTELKRAYYRRAKSCHPDRFGNSRGKTEEFKLLVEAFETLSDPFKRQQYDEKNHLHRQPDEPINPYTGENPGAIMDSDSDDTLEELFVGNTYPQNTSLSTIFVDLQQTDTFLYFREGKNLFYSRRYEAAKMPFMHAVANAPGNIVFQVYMARTFSMLREFAPAKKYYKSALLLGSKRKPPQKLEKVKSELESVKRRHRPLWNGIFRFFAPPKAEFIPCPSETMIDETNRSLAALHHEQQRKKRKELPEQSNHGKH